jgi:tetratricopeptide (TPR) repeat protein
MVPHPLFSWIHLSDIHVGHGDATYVEDQKLVLGALRQDVEQMLASGVPPPDAIFVTGDIAFSGACRTDDEYTRAKRWLSDIAKTAGLDLDAVFVVPGNHDVQRTADKSVMAKALLHSLRQGRLLLDEALADSTAFAQLKMRHANYLAFAANLAPACRTDAEATGAQLYWRHILPTCGGLKVRLVGLNTAILAADEAVFEPDQSRLRLGTRQLSVAFTEPEVAPNEVVIVLGHHPLHDRWLADETGVSRAIQRHAHIYLSGHVHEANSKRTYGGGGTDFVSFAAGAVHGEKNPSAYPARHGYSFGALVADKGALKVRFWPQIWSEENRDFRLDNGNVPRGAKYAEYDLQRVRLPESGAGDSTSTSPVSGIRGERAPAIAGPSEISISRLPTGIEHFVGRFDELAMLDRAWADAGTHVLTIVAWGGTGKSALVAEWRGRMAREKWRGAALVFGWSFDRQGTRNDEATSADLFVSTALKFFGDTDPTKDSASARGVRLANLIRRQRTLLVLDGLEPLQEPEASGGRLRDPALEALLRELAASMNGLCIVTTRQPVSEFAEFVGKTVVRAELDQLSENDGVELLRLCGADDGTVEERREVARAMKGHALSLMLLGHYIADALGGEVRRWREVPLGAAETHPGERARQIMKEYDFWLGQGPERSILRIIGLFDRPASAACVSALRKSPAIAGVTDALVALTEAQWKISVNRLRRTGLLAPAGKPDEGSLDAHPLVRECFGEILAHEHPAGVRDAHRRLYDHLRDAATRKPPDTLDGLQPLYQAVWHGCKAKQYQEALDDVFFARILRGQEHYSIWKFGAFGANLAALAGFFEGDWTQPVTDLDERARTWVLNEAALCLRSLGRLRDAVAPMKSSLDAHVARSDWAGAAIAASNLAELHASLGELSEALLISEHAANFADRSAEALRRISVRTTRAKILHCLGRRENARLLFEEAERMQIEQQPKEHLLHSIQGRWFCELLLDLGEAQKVELRARQLLAWMEEEYWILDIANDQLSLGCALWRLNRREGARIHFTLAIDSLRSAKYQEYFASALVLRGAFLREVGEFAAARRDLDEALVIARRSELRLVECDAYVEEARLALEEHNQAAARTAFEVACSLVSECKYHRRDCELALLEARLAMVDGKNVVARAAYERARTVATAERLRAYDKELSAVEAAVATGIAAKTSAPASDR